MTPSERRVIQAVGRLYRRDPGVRTFTMKRRKGGVYRSGPDCYRWYREPWMTEMLNAYRVMLNKRRKAKS